VSHTTFPHFLRFVFYAVLSMGLLEYHLFNRGSIIYQQRNLPSYLGPSIFALAHLIILLSLNSLVLFALLILLISAIHSLSINTTMIESWEIERHERLAEKARYHGGFVYGPGGRKIRIKKQEFPYDIGIWANLVQGMGTPNVLAWFVPFGGGADNEMGWEFEVNGFEDADVMWPPPDPDRMAQETWTRPREERRGGFVHGKVGTEMEAFRRRQEEDYARRGMLVGDSRGRGAPGSYDWLDMEEDEEGSGYSEGIDGEEGWTNSDGNRLRDFGVDEEAELLDGGEDEDEDDVPLGELLRRRRGRVEVAA
jgi:palmitoyltransferase